MSTNFAVHSPNVLHLYIGKEEVIENELVPLPTDAVFLTSSTCSCLCFLSNTDNFTDWGFILTSSTCSCLCFLQNTDNFTD